MWSWSEKNMTTWLQTYRRKWRYDASFLMAPPRVFLKFQSCCGVSDVECRASPGRKAEIIELSISERKTGQIQIDFPGGKSFASGFLSNTKSGLQSQRQYGARVEQGKHIHVGHTEARSFNLESYRWLLVSLVQGQTAVKQKRYSIDDAVISKLSVR